jgi:ABC-type antimicrobial peptide transport system permease subunit
MALGAQRADVVRLVMREAARVVGFGLAAGLLGAVALTRVLAGMLYGVTGASQAGTYVGAVVVLAIVGGVASYLPARRATSVPPLDALRAE